MLHAWKIYLHLPHIYDPKMTQMRINIPAPWFASGYDEILFLSDRDSRDISKRANVDGPRGPKDLKASSTVILMGLFHVQPEL